MLLLGVVSAAQAQSATPYAQLAKLVETPGAVFVRDSLWMDEAEVANLHYLEYLHFLRLDSTEAQYQSARPDTAVWSQLAGNNLYTSHYLRQSDFRLHPVVGLTWAQAGRYCRWRSALINKRFHSTEYLKKHPKLRQYKFRVEYRLPAGREWELAAAGGLNPAQYPYGVVLPPGPGSPAYRQQLVRPSPAVAKAMVVCLPTADQSGLIFHLPFNVLEAYYQHTPSQSFRCEALDGLIKQTTVTGNNGAQITENTYAYPPNALGMYNMIGNVAELTATPGVAKGGSFRQSIKDVSVQTTIPYAQPQMWLGFRCACTVYIEPLP